MDEKCLSSSLESSFFPHSANTSGVRKMNRGEFTESCEQTYFFKSKTLYSTLEDSSFFPTDFIHKTQCLENTHFISHLCWKMGNFFLNVNFLDLSIQFRISPFLLSMVNRCKFPQSSSVHYHLASKERSMTTEAEFQYGTTALVH